MFIFSGCGSAVPHVLAPDYGDKMPHVIAVLAAAGGAPDRDVHGLFRQLAQEKLVQMGYSLVSLKAVDDRLLRKGLGRDGFYVKTPKELASIVAADAVLYTTITEWDTTLFLTYASIKIGAKFELYDGVTGERLWEAEFGAKDSDMSLEREVVELGIVKAYEPIIQRVIDAVFLTIPENNMIAKGKPKKSYYEWLP